MNTSGDPGIKTLPSNAEGAGSIIVWEANIPNVSRPSQKKKEKTKPIKQKQYCNKFNKDFFKKNEYIRTSLVV